MKKQLVIVGIVTLLVCVGLSGCNKQKTNNPYLDSVKVADVKVVTKGYDGGMKHYVEDGFYHDYPESYYSQSYEITGTVKNKADKPIDRVSIRVNYLDDKGNNLDSSNTYVSSLYIGETKSFSTSLSKSSDYFFHISDYQLQITNVEFH